MFRFRRDANGCVRNEAYLRRLLLMERKEIEEGLNTVESNHASIPERLQEFLELAGNAYFLYKSAFPEERRDLLKLITSNRVVDGKNVDFTLALPFSFVADRIENLNSSPNRDTPRTLTQLFDHLVKWFTDYGATEPGIRISSFIQVSRAARLEKGGDVAM